MKNYISVAILAALLLTSCANEFNKVYKTSDYSYKYEYAKECFAKGKYVRASTLLQGLVTMQKGTDNAQESLYMLGMAEYNSKEYDGAAATFKKYFASYPKGTYAENAEYYVGMSLYLTSSPMATVAMRHSSDSLSFRTSLFRRNSIRHSYITTSASISATVHTEATTTRLASLQHRMP